MTDNRDKIKTNYHALKSQIRALSFDLTNAQEKLKALKANIADKQDQLQKLRKQYLNTIENE